jgi:hypothetical protein
MTKLACPISAMILARGLMSNQERIDKPLTVQEATRLVLESGDKTQVFFGLNRLMNIARDIWPIDKLAAQDLWADIGEHMCVVDAVDPSLLGYHTLLRYAGASSRKDLAAWAKGKAHARDPNQPVFAKAEPAQQIAA